MNSISKIAITGGPCAGKTTLMAKAIEELGNRGLKVLIVPEAATTLIAGMNIVPCDTIDMDKFQAYVLDMQRQNEAIVEKAAVEYVEDKQVVILCDRGTMDGLAYTTSDIMEKMMKARHTNMIEARDEYDAVIHLVTAADGALDAYTLSNNAARTETPAEAIEKDRRTLAAWTGHSHLVIIDNNCTFEQKMDNAIEAIFEVLGIPVPVEKERKFLIRFPDLAALQKYGPDKSNILQTYLKKDGEAERRVRQRGDGINFSFFYTEKTPIPGTVNERAEKERRITVREYAALLNEADYGVMTPITKDRYCFPYGNLYVELDIYKGETQFATLEVEKTSMDDMLQLPPEIEVIREVTEEKAFSNYEISRNGARLPV